MAWSLRISWENGQTRASFSHFMWTKPKGRQTNICTFKTIITWGKSPLSWGRSPLPSPCCDCINFFLPAYCEKQPGIRLYRSLVEFRTEQSKVQGIWWIKTMARFRISNRIFWGGPGDPVRDEVEDAKSSKACRGCPLPIYVSKTLHHFEKLESEQM